MRARSLLPALLLLLLPLAVDAHPPKDAPLDGDEVMGAANAVMADMKERPFVKKIRVVGFTQLS